MIAMLGPAEVDMCWQVYGVDISSHMQPDDLPLNLHLQVSKWHTIPESGSCIQHGLTVSRRHERWRPHKSLSTSPLQGVTKK